MKGKKIYMQEKYNQTRAILKKYGIKPNKNLGQNFLIDAEIIEEIVHSSNLNKDDIVIEIGPGLGVLTKELLKKAKKVICIELDQNMVRILKDRFILYNNIKIINDDILKTNLSQIINKEKKECIGKIKIVANLPYYITTPIVMKLLEEKLEIDEIIIMVQKEVAQRLIAKPGEKHCGAITYTVNYYAEGTKEIDVLKEAFLPQPEVESQVIKLIPRKVPPISIQNEKKFFELVKTIFTQRRKTLMNAVINKYNNISKNEMQQIIKDLGLNEKVRGEALTLEQVYNIYNKICKKE